MEISISAEERSERPSEAAAAGLHGKVSIIPEGMSKNQWKKQLKKQKMEQGRAEWRRKQKEKEKEKKRKRREEGQPAPGPPTKKHKMSATEASPVQVAIDLGYQDLMNDLDIKMLMKQCQRCYAANRRAESPLQLTFTSFGGRCKQRLEQATQGYHNWDVHFRTGDYVEEFGSENVVFLAAESPNILKDFSPDKVYVIGGLVDHNHYKGHCYQSAISKGVDHAQLPISEYLTLNSRKVLAVNHVYEIILAYIQCGDWRQSFHQVIPQRKLAKGPAPTPETALAPPPTAESPTSDDCTDPTTTASSLKPCGGGPTDSLPSSSALSTTTTATPHPSTADRPTTTTTTATPHPSTADRPTTTTTTATPHPSTADRPTTTTTTATPHPLTAEIPTTTTTTATPHPSTADRPTTTTTTAIPHPSTAEIPTTTTLHPSTADRPTTATSHPSANTANDSSSVLP